MSSDKESSKVQELESIARRNSFIAARSIFETKIKEEKARAAGKIWKGKLAKIAKDMSSSDQPTLKASSSLNHKPPKLSVWTQGKTIDCASLDRAASSIAFGLSQVSLDNKQHNSGEDVVEWSSSQKSFQANRARFELLAQMSASGDKDSKPEKVVLDPVQQSPPDQQQQSNPPSPQVSRLGRFSLGCIDHLQEPPESLLYIEQCEKDKHNYEWSKEVKRINCVQQQQQPAVPRRLSLGWNRRGIIKRNISTPEADDIPQPCKLPAELPWCQRVRSGPYAQLVTKHMSKNEIKVFENMYEIITSEETYLNELLSIKIFTTSAVAMKLPAEVHTIMFKDIDKLYSISQNVYQKLNQSIKHDIFMRTMFHELSTLYREREFSPYVTFLVEQDERREVVAKYPALKDINSKLLTPMQRITRYPLCLANIIKKLTDLLAVAQKPIPKRLNFTRNSLAYSSVGPSPSVQPPKLKLLLDEANVCFEHAKKFANECDNAFQVKAGRKALEEFNASLSDKVPGLTHSSHELLQQLDVYAFSLTPKMCETIKAATTMDEGMTEAFVEKGSTLRNYQHRLLMLNKLMVLAKEVPLPSRGGRMHQGYRYVLVDSVKHEEVNYSVEVKVDNHALLEFHGMRFLVQFKSKKDYKEFVEAVVVVTSKSEPLEVTSSLI